MRRQHNCLDHARYTIGCDACGEQARAYGRLLAREDAYGIARRIPVSEVREHVEHLLGQGWNASDIARASGVGRTTIHKIIHGQVATVYAHVHDAIMATQAGVRTMVDATGTQRRLQHLMLMGWTGEVISEGTGVIGSVISRIIMGRNEKTTVETAEAVQTFFREHWDQDGGSTRARNRARREGWVSALAFDDIDDPAERPTGLPRDEVESRQLARLDTLQELADMGERWVSSTVRRAGFSKLNTAAQFARRHGREDIIAQLKSNTRGVAA